MRLYLHVVSQANLNLFPLSLMASCTIPPFATVLCSHNLLLSLPIIFDFLLIFLSLNKLQAYAANASTHCSIYKCSVGNSAGIEKLNDINPMMAVSDEHFQWQLAHVRRKIYKKDGGGGGGGGNLNFE